VILTARLVRPPHKALLLGNRPAHLALEWQARLVVVGLIGHGHLCFCSTGFWQPKRRAGESGLCRLRIMNVLARPVRKSLQVVGEVKKSALFPGKSKFLYRIRREDVSTPVSRSVNTSPCCGIQVTMVCTKVTSLAGV
jgi:hypothetical protein